MEASILTQPPRLSHYWCLKLNNVKSKFLFFYITKFHHCYACFQKKAYFDMQLCTMQNNVNCLENVAIRLLNKLKREIL